MKLRVTKEGVSLDSLTTVLAIIISNYNGNIVYNFYYKITNFNTIRLSPDLAFDVQYVLRSDFKSVEDIVAKFKTSPVKIVTGADLVGEINKYLMIHELMK